MRVSVITCLFSKLNCCTVGPLSYLPKRLKNGKSTTFHRKLHCWWELWTLLLQILFVRLCLQGTKLNQRNIGIIGIQLGDTHVMFRTQVGSLIIAMSHELYKIPRNLFTSSKLADPAVILYLMFCRISRSAFLSHRDCVPMVHECWWIWSHYGLLVWKAGIKYNCGLKLMFSVSLITIYLISIYPFIHFNILFVLVVMIASPDLIRLYNCTFPAGYTDANGNTRLLCKIEVDISLFSQGEPHRVQFL